MSTDDRFTTAVDPEKPLSDLLSYAKLLDNPKLARLYIYVLQRGPVTVEAVKTDLDVPHSTAYKYVSELEEMGVLTRHESETPTTINADPIHLELTTQRGELRVTPVLVAAVARSLETDDIRIFLDRHGVAKLAAALHYAIRVMDGDLTQRTAANRLDVHPVEGMTAITALQDVIEAATEYDPYLDFDDE